jgi:hypothetical protein
MAPPAPPVLEPDSSDNEPLSPENDVPVLKEIEPDAPKDFTLLVTKLTDPEPEDELPPDDNRSDPPIPDPVVKPPLMLTEPPRPVADLVSPAAMTRFPPLPESPLPTTTRTAPPRPPLAVPLNTSIEPLFPAFVVPVLSTIAPLVP